MWNKSVKIPTGKKTTEDEDGFELETMEYMEHVPANFRDCTRNDQMLAKQCGYDVSVTIDMMACNYNGQSRIIDEDTGEEYSVKRKFQKEKSMTVSLLCERRDSGGV